MKNIPEQKMRVMSIVHGRYEYQIGKAIRSNLKLKHGIIADKNGRKSIQISSVMNTLNDRRFRSCKDFTNEFTDIEHNKNRLIEFSLLIIMDVDDCSSQEKERFISKEMFRDHWLFEYIVPIYNDPNLEQTMQAANIPIRKKKDYITVFPSHPGGASLDLAMAEDFARQLASVHCSNLSAYVDCWLRIARESLF